MHSLPPTAPSPTLGDYKNFLTPLQKDPVPPGPFYLDRTAPSGLSTTPPPSLVAKKNGGLWSGIVGAFWTDPEELAQTKALKENLLQAIRTELSPEATGFAEHFLTVRPYLSSLTALHVIHQSEAIDTAITSITASLASIKGMTLSDGHFPSVQKMADTIEKETASLTFHAEPDKDSMAILEKNLQALQKLQTKAHFLLELREELVNDIQKRETVRK